MRTPSLNALRDSIKSVDDDVFLEIAEVLQVNKPDTRSNVSCEMRLINTDTEITAEYVPNAVGDNAGFHMLPQVGDWCIVCFASGDEDQAYIFSRMTSNQDKIPKEAMDDDIVMAALNGKKSWILGNRVNLGKGGETEPGEPLVLGNTFIEQLNTALSNINTAITNLNTAFKAHVHPDPSSGMTGPTSTTAETSAANNSIDGNMVLSNVAYTERVEDAEN